MSAASPEMNAWADVAVALQARIDAALEQCNRYASIWQHQNEALRDIRAALSGPVGGVEQP